MRSINYFDEPVHEILKNNYLSKASFKNKKIRDFVQTF